MKRGPGPSRKLATRLGVQLGYWDVAGGLRRPPPEAVRGVWEALDVDPDQPPGAVEPVAVAWGGRLRMRMRPSGTAGRADVWVRQEDGEERAWRRLSLHARVGGVWELRLPAKLPFGVHQARVELEGGSHRCTVISAPRRLRYPRGLWGVFAPVYALWSSPGQPVGDFHDLRLLAEATAAWGGHVVATLPLLPVFPEDPSPYRPVSRLVWNELLVHLPGVTPSGNHLVDYRAASLSKRKALQERSGRLTPAENREFLAWLADHPHVQDYARFRVACEHLGRPWRRWPTDAREGRWGLDASLPAVRAYAYAQWLAHTQIEQGFRRCGLYLDFPLGVHPDGYDAWRYRHLFVEGVSVGAPPDPFSAGGQDWGFAPLHPWRVREEGYGYLRRCLAHHFRACRLLRLDHVMALHRLFWIPRGFPTSAGVYVRYPTDELYAVVLLEAWRAGAAVVGEDLGTVPQAVRRRLDRHGVLRMYVLAFEVRPGSGPLPPGANTVASLGTHDTATFAGWWSGEDLTQLESLGLLGPEEAAAARAARAAQVEALARFLGVGTDDPASALRACVRFLASSPAACVVVNLEDLWLERHRHNVPGTTDQQHPNWRRRLARSVSEVLRSSELRQVLEELRQARSSGCQTGWDVVPRPNGDGEVDERGREP